LFVERLLAVEVEADGPGEGRAVEDRAAVVELRGDFRLGPAQVLEAREEETVARERLVAACERREGGAGFGRRPGGARE
jgi:hypothetical protein